MAYTPTGRPVGRPKTKEYQTISLKMPQALLARVQTYARLHRQSISALIREGLEWRMTDGDPRDVGGSAPPRTPHDADEYSRNTTRAAAGWGEPEAAGMLQEIRTALARQETQLHALTQALEQRTVARASQEYSGNTALQELSKPLPLVETLIPCDDDLSTTDARAETTMEQDNSCNTVLHERGEPDTAPSQPQGETGDDTRQTANGLVPREQTALAAPVHENGQKEIRTDDLDDMPLEPENGPATLVRQPDNEPSGREAAPAETADTPGADTPVARRRALLLAAVPWEADTPGGVSPAALRSATGLRKIDVANDLDDLCTHGQVVKVRKGQYVRREPVPRTGQDTPRQTTLVPAASEQPAAVHRTHMSQPIHEQMSSETLPGQTQGRAENITRQTAIPPYDTTRYILGKLCTHGHDYHGTGHSSRRLSDRECLECLKARRSAYRERQRQARPA